MADRPPFGKPETDAIRIKADASGFREHSSAIYMTSSFTFENAEQARSVFAGEEEGLVYSRYGNPNLVVATVSDIVAVEIAPQPSRLEPNDRIGLGVERLVAPEHGDGDRVALQFVSAASERFFDDVPEELDAPVAGLEVGICNDLLELCAHGFRSGDIPRLLTF